jgi:hypothetical protein
MLNYNTKYPTQTTTPDADYPLGGAQNVTSPGDGTGTPWEADLINDIIGFFQALITETGITVSGNAETAQASDLLDALQMVYQYLNTYKILINDSTTSSPGTAQIGNGYQGSQRYGASAIGTQYYGLSASGTQYYGDVASGDQYYGRSASGEQSYGESATSTQFYGKSASGEQYYGNAASAKQSYGESATGTQFYGRNATQRCDYSRGASGDTYLGFDASGGIEIGSVSGSHATKKLVSGAKSATFENIIDSAVPWGSWQTIAYDTGTTAPTSSSLRQSMVCRKSSDGKNVQISGAFKLVSGTNTIGILPVGYRPANTVGITGSKATGDFQSCQMRIDTSGNILVYNHDNVDIAFEAIIPLD